jgi:hypothetical protein
MAAKYDEIGRKVDLLNDQGSSDRARRINSLNRTVTDLAEQENKRKIDFSSGINSLSSEQKRMMKRLNDERDAFSNQTMQSYNTVVKGLGSTINRLATGIKYITTETAKATKDAIGQYARAIGEDISVNKTNAVAMALSSASPIFGYFASKFMETDVFQNAADKIKSKLGDAVSGGFSRLGRMVGIGKKAKYDEEGVPQLQSGGYVKKGGVVKVHAAEVVMPAEKVMTQINKAKDSAIARQMGTTMVDMSETLADVQENVEDAQEKNTNIIQTFMSEWGKAQAEEDEVGNSLQDVVSEIRELKVSMIGITPSWELALERTLDKHPFYKGVFKMYKLFDSMIPKAFKWLFGRKSKYAAEVARAGSGTNVFDRIVSVTGLLYTGIMPKLDELVKYNKALAEGILGKTLKPPKEQFEESNYQKLKNMFSKKEKKGGEGGKGKGGKEKSGMLNWLFNYVVDQASDEDDIGSEMKKAGISGFGDFFKKKTWAKAGITKKSLKEKVGLGGVTKKDITNITDKLPKNMQDMKDMYFDLKFQARGLKKKAEHKLGKGASKEEIKKETLRMYEEIRAEVIKKKSSLADKIGTKDELSKKFVDKVLSYLNKIAKAETDREEREGPHSPSMADNIASTAKVTKSESKRQKKSDEIELTKLEKTHRAVKEVGENINEMSKKGLRRVSDWLLSGLTFLFSMLSSVVRTGFNMFFNLMGGVLKAIGLPIPGRGLLGRGFKKIGMEKIGKKVSGKRSLGEIASGTGKNIATKFKKKGIGGALGGMAKGAGELGTAAAGKGISKGWGMVKGAGKALAPGIGATAKFGGKVALKGLGLAGRFLAAPVMALVELGLSAGDAISAIMNPEEFGASRISAGIGAFIAGKDSGFSGAASGAMKWGAIGATVGSIIPGVGTLIGGAVGALAGAVLGFIGGPKIAQAMDWIGGLIKPIAKAAWFVISLPFKAIWWGLKGIWWSFKALWEGVKSVVVLVKFLYKKTIGPVIDSISEWWSSTEGIGEEIRENWDNAQTKLSSFFQGIMSIWDLISKYSDAAKKWLAETFSFLTPVVNFIGKYIGEVWQGTLAENLERALEGKPSVQEEAAYKHEYPDLAASAAKRYKAEVEREAQMALDQTEAIAGAVQKGANQQTNAVNNSTTVITNSVNNSSSTGGGGGVKMNREPSPRAQKTAEQMQFCLTS